MWCEAGSTSWRQKSMRGRQKGLRCARQVDLVHTDQRHSVRNQKVSTYFSWPLQLLSLAHQVFFTDLNASLASMQRMFSEGQIKVCAHFNPFKGSAGPGSARHSCWIMFDVLRSPQGGQGGSAVPVFRDGRRWQESELYSTENKNKALNDTEEGITMSAVPQCYEILLWTKTPIVAQGLCVCARQRVWDYYQSTRIMYCMYHFTNYCSLL